ncbi:MAG: serine protease, peptidase S9 family protein, partial [bacterium]|nr:serine protease, peptidase S9 family protein [bacterium]
MKKIISSLLLLMLSSTLFAQWNYPKTKTGDTTDTYFGVTYNDPYRWLEDLKSPDVISWFKEQADLTNNTMSKISGRDELIAEWKKLDKLQPPVYYYPIKENGRIFYQKR